MKLIQQKKLHFQEGNSDKIYEADICEVGDNQYVVNFRYGRRGANLTEGSKTVFPVPLDKAQKIFDELIKDKTKKGYQDVSGQVVAGTEMLSTPVTSETFTPEEARKRAILRRLQLGINTPTSKVHKKWQVSRVAWRAGELGLTEAAPLLIELAQKAGDKIAQQYSAVYALSQCANGENADVVAFLNSLRTDKSVKDFVARAATVGLLRIATGGTRKLLLEQLVAALPPAFQDQIQKGNKDTLLRLLNEQINSARAKRRHPAGYLLQLYLLQQDYPHVRPALMAAIKTLPMTAGFFKPLRGIFKAAEQWEDAQMFGLIAYKIDKNPGTFAMSASNYEGGRWVSAKEDIKREDTIYAYSHKTRAYLIRRISRYLDKLAETNQAANFVKAATALLASYDDASDAKAPRNETKWQYNNKTRRWDSLVTAYDSYADYWLLNCLLFSESKRYKANGASFMCINDYQPGQPLPADREEAYQGLWDQMPTAYVYLLMEAKATPVVEFALRAFRLHPQYNELSGRFTIKEAARFLQHSSAMLVDYGLSLATKFYNPKQPNLDLVMVMLGSKVQKVRQQASAWIDQNLDFFFQETEFIKNMLTHSAPDIREWMHKQMSTVATKLSTEKRQTLIARLLSYLLHSQNLSNEQIKAITDDILLKYFAEELRSLSLEVVGDVLASPSAMLQWFASQMLLQHSAAADAIPFDHIQHLVAASAASLQNAGETLLSRVSTDKLWLYREQLYQWTLDKGNSVRHIGKTYLAKILPNHDEFAAELVGRYIRVMLKKETWEGIHIEASQALQTTLSSYLHVIERDLIFRMLNSDYRPAQELAAILIERYVPAESLTLRSIIRFAENEVLQVRRLAWRMFENNIPRIKYEREEAIRLLDANWDDSRNFAINFFRQHFTENDWTPTILVAICDSNREDIQALGRELITRFFNAEHGEEYLLKLTQHPRPALQQYATNYLQQFATGNMAVLQKLEFYFITVLSHVNKARTAKDRIFAFLYNEAMNNEKAAALVTGILNRISGTVAIEDKAKCIEYLRDIQVKYPHLETAVKLLA